MNCNNSSAFLQNQIFIRRKIKTKIFKPLDVCLKMAVLESFLFFGFLILLGAVICWNFSTTGIVHRPAPMSEEEDEECDD